METANEIMKQVVPILMVPINNYLRYLISCRKYMQDMDIKMTRLNAIKLGVDQKTKQNVSNHLEVPDQVKGWVEDVGKINAKVENLPRDMGCFNLKVRLRAGRNAFEVMQEIDSLITRHSDITWTDNPIPLARVDSMMASTSTPSSAEHQDFQSREVTFKKALKALGANHKAHMIALCGMGGVGKTTMMQTLKKVVKQRRMFDYIIEVVVGETTDLIAIQEVVANLLKIELKENDKSIRAKRLCKWFKDNSNRVSNNPDEGKNKFLILLDDVWQSFDLTNIGLSHLPNEGVDFKVLLTSRDKQVCFDIGVEVDSVLEVKLLTEAEAQSLFCQFSGTVDPELLTIGERIVRKCGGLPIAIKIMAGTLKNKRKDTWYNALSRLEYHDVDKDVNEVFKISYDNLQGEETKCIFLLCGLYPEDFNIPTEELVRYGWGLKLSKKVYTIREARYRVNACIERLIHTNLLMESDVGCVKMHDLVRAFVLDKFSKVEHASVVNHGSLPGWPESDMNDSDWRSISLTCKNMSEFPKDLRFPNLLILKLMHGDKSLRFPQEFYREMKNLHVISYDKMKCPLQLPTPAQCLTNLRVLHLHGCSLTTSDCSSIGNLLNLEVLDFANSDIKLLPSMIGNLKKLRILDLTNCYGLRIENGVLKNLIKLEELYMRVVRDYIAIRLTRDNCNEIAELSKNLCSLEFEFFENYAQPKNMSFEKLQRFKISVGCHVDGDLSNNEHSFENTLQLVSNKGEVLKSRMNELFQKTEVLYLSLGDMTDLLDVEVKSSHPPQPSSFYNLRVLVVKKCEVLRYIFTLGVANTLSKLEHLQVYKCNNIEELIDSRGSREEKITILPKLKFLSLSGLPKLLGLCLNVNIIELPQLVELKLDGIPGFKSSWLKEEVVTPKLEKLFVGDLENLKEIWPCGFSTSEEVNLRKIKVSKCANLMNLFPDNPMPLLHHLEELEVENCGSLKVLFDIDLDCGGEIGECNRLRVIKVNNCDNLVNLFPCNPIPFLHHLQELEVENCGSIEVLFNIDLDAVGDVGEGGVSKLRSIKVKELGRLREVWSIKGENNSCPIIRGFQAVESIRIEKCKRFRNVLTPTTIDFDLGSLMEVGIYACGFETMDRQRISKNRSIFYQSTSQANDSISNVVFPSCQIQHFHNLRMLILRGYKGVEVVFEIERPRSRGLVTQENQQQILPYLEHLDISYMESLIHVWKCNQNKFLILQKRQSESPFSSLTTINLSHCSNIKYLFSPLMAKLLSNLKKVEIEDCLGIEEVVSNRDDEDEEKTTITSTSTHTSTTWFARLDSLNLTSLPNLKRIGGGVCANGGNNENSFNNSTTTTAFVNQFKFSHLGGISWNFCQYPREIRISLCHALSSVIPCYATGEMPKLQVLKISNCNRMKEVFETQGMSNRSSGCDEVKGGTLAIPRLSNVIMLKLLNLKALQIEYCSLLGYVFPFSMLESLVNLEELIIGDCEAMEVIVKKEEDDGEQTITISSKEVVIFPRLKSIRLFNLQKLVGFFSGKNEFRLPSLDNVTIKKCPRMRVFAPGGSTTPKLKYIHTIFGKHCVEECGLNFHVITAGHYQAPFSSSYRDTSEGMPRFFCNLIELHLTDDFGVTKIIPSNELLQLQKLEKIYATECGWVEEVFALEAGTNGSNGFDESQTTLVKLPNLTQVELDSLYNLRHIWKSNQWTVFEFPNLTKLSVYNCDKLKHVFTTSMVGSLLQLQQLSITRCSEMVEVIVKDDNVVQVEEQEEADGKTNEIVLARLKFLQLDGLTCLKGFCLGKKDFSFPLLDTLIIRSCPSITTFTKGNSATPQLIEILTNIGLIYVAGKDINSILKIKLEHKDVLPAAVP